MNARQERIRFPSICTIHTRQGSPQTDGCLARATVDLTAHPHRLPGDCPREAVCSTANGISFRLTRSVCDPIQLALQMDTVSDGSGSWGTYSIVRRARPCAVPEMPTYEYRLYASSRVASRRLHRAIIPLAKLTNTADQSQLRLSAYHTRSSFTPLRVSLNDSP